MNRVLSVRGLHKRFTLHLRGSASRVVLSDVSLDLHAGECVALVGPSGQGKSTLVKCLYGAYGIERGVALLQGSGGEVDLAQASALQMRALRRRDIAYVSQFLRAVPRVPALHVVAERAIEAYEDASSSEADIDTDPAPAAQARDAARALLRRLNLPEALWPLPPTTFSGGEQQRVNIARGFIVPARLLLLDEPTASLDAANRRVVIDLINEAKRGGAAVVGIFHDEEVRAAVATRCLDLANENTACPTT